MEGPLRLWQILVYLEMSPPLYTQDLPALHMTGPSHVLLQISPYYEDLDGEYHGGVAECHQTLFFAHIFGPFLTQLHSLSLPPVSFFLFISPMSVS